MARYIDAELIDGIIRWDKACAHFDDDDIDRILKAIIKIPIANVQEIKHGHWIKHKADTCGWRGCDTVECSVCHAEEGYLLDDNYCPNCGVKMDEETKK